MVIVLWITIVYLVISYIVMKDNNWGVIAIRVSTTNNNTYSVILTVNTNKLKDGKLFVLTTYGLSIREEERVVESYLRDVYREYNGDVISIELIG